MKKKTISAILLGFNICLALFIVILIFLIVQRGPKPMEEIAQAEAEEEAAVSANDIYQDESKQEEIVPDVTEVLVCIPTATSSVNVRSGPGVNYDRIGSAYSVNEYEVIAILNNGWTKLDYDGQEGFVSSEYLMFQMKSTDNETLVDSYVDATQEQIDEYMIYDYEEEIPEEPEEGDDVDDDGVTDDEAASADAEAVFEDLEE